MEKKVFEYIEQNVPSLSIERIHQIQQLRNTQVSFPGTTQHFASLLKSGIDLSCDIEGRDKVELSVGGSSMRPHTVMQSTVHIASGLVGTQSGSFFNHVIFKCMGSLHLLYLAVLPGNVAYCHLVLWQLFYW